MNPQEPDTRMQIRCNPSLLCHSDDSTRDGDSKKIVYEAVILGEAHIFLWKKVAFLHKKVFKDGVCRAS